MGVALLVGGLQLVSFVLFMREYFPQIDVNSWTCIEVAAPPLFVAMQINMFVGTALYVRAFARKKGPEQTLRYLFPGSNRGTYSRLLLRAAGLRETQPA
jgi:hypothetical protein